jgi:cytochrome oxidase assembly protein ShyY1
VSSRNARRFHPRWFGYLAIALVFAAACVALSNWQFARRTEAATKVSLVETNYDATSKPVAQVLSAHGEFDRSTMWRPVTAQGHYLPEYATLVRNRVVNNEAGFDSLVPFLMQDGTVIVVDRGWIVASGGDMPAGAIPLPSSDTTTVTVRLRASEPTIQGQQSTAVSIPTVNVKSLSQRWGFPTYTALYGELVNESPAVGESLQLAAKPELTEGNHLSYALQWIAFAIMGFVGLGWIIVRERQIALTGPNRIARRRAKSRDETEEDRLIESQLAP